ncbi:MAG: hypothetical protein FJX44_02505 [Alphaproteobacteria bacterium]|nr:hypothetical protein [Alphaproteobacteria bacterium]
MRKAVLILVSMTIGVLIPLIVFEIALRFMPVNEGIAAARVNESDPIFHFIPDQNLIWSRGWDFSQVNRVRVNNTGFVNDQDYDRSSDDPLFAVIGDSYVEAAMVPYAETIQGRLAQLVGPDGRVYSFAASGAPLSQYLVWTRDARMWWRAEALAVVIVGNDFDESLAAYMQRPGFHYYFETSDGTLTLRRVDYEPSWGRELVKRSALLRYLVLNLQTLDRLKSLSATFPSITRPAKADDFVGNTPRKRGAARLERSRNAIRAFLRDMVTYAGWRPDQVVFVVDGIRHPTDNPRVKSSYFMQIREFFMSEARLAGFEVVDMDKLFFALLRGKLSLLTSAPSTSTGMERPMASPPMLSPPARYSPAGGSNSFCPRVRHKALN